MDREGLRALTRDALDHLYEEPLLQQHPLAELLVPEASAASRGLALRRALVAAIQQFRPPHTIALISPVWRRYRSLCQRYIEGKTFKEIAEGETISARQAVRDHHEALETLLDAIWAAYGRAREPATAPSEPATVASASVQPDDAMGLEGELLRLSNGGAGATREPIRLDEVLADALVVLQPLVSTLGTTLERKVPATLPQVTVDRSMLRQALLNVLSYAVERSSGGKITIEANPGASEVELLIAATGWREPLGDAAEEGARLAISRRLVEVEGGELDERFVEGRGLVVRLAFPVAPAATVLVVDDNPDLARLFRRYLSGTRYQIVQATTGQRALELASELHLIAITLDLMMPSQDGWELLQSLLRDPVTTRPPIVVCSVLPARALALAVGASHFLAKPVTQEALLAVLASCQSETLERLQAWPQAARQLGD
jgi:CheY-like chemotaxis protein